MSQSLMNITLGTIMKQKGVALDRDCGPLRISLDYAIESAAIIARKGMGKTHTARAIVEDMLHGGVQVVVIDPLDVWWGLRASADGKSKGADVIIFGGEHADVPLTEHMGKLLASLVVEREISVVLVLDHLSKAASRRFMADFCEHLYGLKTKHRTPLHMVLDEADIFIPQKPPPDAMRCLGVVDSMVRHGRSRGLGTTVITQRPAVIAKDVLTQTEVLITLGLTSPQDRKAVTEWINAQATVEEAKTFLASLAGLQRGEAWIWSPSTFKVFELIKVRALRTYDSSYTPTVGAHAGKSGARPVPKLEPVDLERIKGEIETVTKEAAENDPKVLKERLKSAMRTIDVINKQLAYHAASNANVALGDVVVRKDVQDYVTEVVTKQVHQAIRKRDATWQTSISEAQQTIMSAVQDAMRIGLLDPELDKAYVLVGHDGGTIESRTIKKHLSLGIPDQHRRTLDILSGGASASMAGKPMDKLVKAQRLLSEKMTGIANASADTEGATPLSGPERRVLTVLAQHDEHHPQNPYLDKKRIAIRVGYGYNSTFRNQLSNLRGRGAIVDADSNVAITPRGRSLLGTFEPMPSSGEDLYSWWYNRLSGPEQRVLQALWDVRLASLLLAPKDLADRSGYGYNSTFRNQLSSLRTKGLIEGYKTLVLAEDLRR